MTEEKKIRTIGNLFKGPIRFGTISGNHQREADSRRGGRIQKSVRKRRGNGGEEGAEEERGKTSRGEKRLSSAGFRCARKRGYPGLNEWRRKSGADVRGNGGGERERDREGERKRGIEGEEREEKRSHRSNTPARLLSRLRGCLGISE